MPVTGINVALNVFFWVTFASAAVALFAPFWVTTDLSKLPLAPALSALNINFPLISQGQLVLCSDPYNEDDSRDCDWIIGEQEVGFNIPGIGGVSSGGEPLPYELETSQYLSIAGTALFLIGAILTFFVCGSSAPNNKALTASLLAIAVLGGMHSFITRRLHFYEDCMTVIKFSRLNVTLVFFSGMPFGCTGFLHVLLQRRSARFRSSGS